MEKVRCSIWINLKQLWRTLTKKIETMHRSELDALVEERIHYTIKYASESSLQEMIAHAAGHT